MSCADLRFHGMVRGMSAYLNGCVDASNQVPILVLLVSILRFDSYLIS